MKQPYYQVSYKTIELQGKECFIPQIYVNGNLVAELFAYGNIWDAADKAHDHIRHRKENKLDEPYSGGW